MISVPFVVAVGVPDQQEYYTIPAGPLHAFVPPSFRPVEPGGFQPPLHNPVIPWPAAGCTPSPGEVGRRRGDGVPHRPVLLSRCELHGGAVLEFLDLLIEATEHPDVGDRSRD